MDDIVIDKYVIENGKVKHKNRKKTNDLKKWFDEEIGYDALDGFI